MILAGDIGGTKTVIALFERVGADELRAVAEKVYPSASHSSLEEILLAFLKEYRTGHLVAAAAFGIAGAVIDGQVHATNLAWQISETHLAEAIGVKRLHILNDLEAAAYGMPRLTASELAVLNPGSASAHPGNIAVIAAGTGLGEAMLVWDGQRYVPVASEGGHADFAPRSEREIELLRYLRHRLGDHVSYERVISGPGLFNIYCFLRDCGYGSEPEWLQARLAAGGDPSAIVSETGLAGKSPLCEATLQLFAQVYGAEAGNLALRCLARGGVFISGGIAPKLLKILQQGAFMRSFAAKGRFARFLNSIAVRVALNPRAPLIGAAHFALTLCEAPPTDLVPSATTRSN